MAECLKFTNLFYFISLSALSGRHAILRPITHRKYFQCCNIEQGCQLQIRAIQCSWAPKTSTGNPLKITLTHSYISSELIILYLLEAFLDVSASLSSMSTTKKNICNGICLSLHVYAMQTGLASSQGQSMIAKKHAHWDPQTNRVVFRWLWTSPRQTF